MVVGRFYGGAFVAMAPSPSYQPVATGPVAMGCDPPAQCATTRASSLRGCFRGDGALAIVSACRPPFGRNGLRPSRATHDDEGVVATGALSWRWRPRHRISLPSSVRSQWIATLPRNARRRGRRRYGCAFVAMCDDEGVVATKFNKWPNAIANRKSKIVNPTTNYQLPFCARHLARAVVFRINRLILRCCTFALAFGGALCHNMGPSGVNWFEFFSRNDQGRRE